jgi:hypothetical protein
MRLLALLSLALLFHAATPVDGKPATTVRMLGRTSSGGLILTVPLNSQVQLLLLLEGVFCKHLQLQTNLETLPL